MLSTREAARIVGMPEAVVRKLVRAGLGRPARRGGRYAFAFQDLVVLRTANRLIGEGVPATRVARSLAALAEGLPEGQPLSSLRIRAEAGRVVVDEEGLRWHPETGQTVLPFEARSAEPDATSPAAPIPTPRRSAAQSEALAEFERALALEDRDPVEACSAYGRAIELDPSLSDAYVNLGRIAHEAGQGSEAIRLFELALEREPEDPLIHYNLGLAVEDVRGSADAERHYRRALDLDGEFADAHFNLAALCEKLDRPQEALRHYHAYKRLTEDS